MLSEMNIPKTKQDLIKRLNTLKNIQIKIVEPITRKDINTVRGEVDKFVGNDSISIIMIKSK
tara:strand:+ start:3305 stop:3490 length:186 start_codon:yes stop_codon:yes gene_type:complete